MSKGFEITKEEFDKLFDHAVEFGNALLNDRRVSIVPQLFVLVVDKTMQKNMAVIVVADEFNDFDEKCIIMEEIGRNLARERLVALAAVLISEAWLSRKAIDEDVQPRHASDRRECIITAGMSVDKEFIRMHTQPVLRYNGGLMADGKPEHDTNDDSKNKVEFPLMKPFFRAHLETWRDQL